tara:strand:- start:4617 stop:4799 length:183 start_codon:yes stop_codon:yes gene_type:complete
MSVDEECFYKHTSSLKVWQYGSMSITRWERELTFDNLVSPWIIREEGRASNSLDHHSQQL